MRKMRARMLLLGALALTARMPAAAAVPLQGTDPNYLLLEDYVRQTVATLPGQVLPDYGPAAYALQDQLMASLGTLTGLNPSPQTHFWCGAAMECVISCVGATPVAEFSGYSLQGNFGCFLESVPIEAYHETEQLALSHQSPGSHALYVVFFNPLTWSDVYAFPISQSAPFYGPDRYCTAAPNSVGPGAALDLTGTTSLAANDLVLHAAPLPDQPGLFFLGTGETWPPQPFGDGFRCTAGPLLRLPTEVAAGGVLTHALDFTDPSSAASSLAAGSVWYVQAWYRDPAAGGAGFNLSDGLGLWLCP